MKRLLFLILALGLGLSPAWAQTVSRGVTLTADPTYTVGSDHPLRLDTAGRLYTTITGTVVTAPGLPTPSTPVVSTAAEANHVLKATPGSLVGLTVTTGATAGYVLVFNSTTAPADGAVTPIYCFSLPATSSLGVSFPVPAAFSTGITASFSSTGCFTKTASATAFFSGLVQ